jgi:hypothetical protein
MNCANTGKSNIYFEDSLFRLRAFPYHDEHRRSLLLALSPWRRKIEPDGATSIIVDMVDRSRSAWVFKSPLNGTVDEVNLVGSGLDGTVNGDNCFNKATNAMITSNARIPWVTVKNPTFAVQAVEYGPILLKDGKCSITDYHASTLLISDKHDF